MRLLEAFGRRLFSRSTSVKDYQLGDWIEMLGPLLDGQDGGAELARWLCGALVELRLRHRRLSRQPAPPSRCYAAESHRRPGHAWRIGHWLEHELRH